MSEAPVQLAKQLAKQLAEQSKDASVVARIVALSASDDAFLTTPRDSSFNAAWPCDYFHLENAAFTEAFLGLCGAVRDIDPRLQKRSDRLVPKKTDEPGFWRCYFGHLLAVLNGTELEPTAPASEAPPASGAEAGSELSHLTEEERKEWAESGLPAPRPLAQRRFPPASKLQTTGEMKAVQMLAFVKEAAAMVCSAETTAVMNTAAEQGGSRGAASELLQSQLELMEAHGFDRRFGCKQLEGNRVTSRFPRDAALHTAIRNFQMACQQATQRAVQRAMQRAPADFKARRFPPAAVLRRGGSGEPERDELLSILAGVEEWMRTAETRRQLSEAAARGEPPQCLLFRQQREYLESRGLEQDFGMQQVWSIPARFADEKDALRVAHKRLRELCETLPKEAVVDASKPEVKPRGQRRFEAAEGALQTEGELEREWVLRFCKEVVAMLMSPESIALLAAAEAQREAPQLSVCWQREMLEHLGVEQDYGCRALSNVPRRFEADPEVLRAFKGFQTGCVVSLKKAASEREAMAAAKGVDAAAKGVEELRVASHEHGHHHPVGAGKGCGEEGCQHDHSH